MITTLLSNKVLTGDNYVEWKTNTNLVLTCFDYQFVLTEECPSESTSEARVRWIKGNRIVRCYLLANMSGPLRAKHEGLETAHEIMESLEKMYSQTHFGSCLEAVKAVVNTRMRPGTSVRAHVLSMMGHIGVAERNGVVMDQATQVRMVLETLSPAFVSFRVDYVSNKKLYSMTELLCELEAFESRIRGGASIVGQKRKIGGKYELDCSLNKKDEKEDLKNQCFHCGGDGHWKRNCLLYLAELREGKENRKF